MIYRSNAAVKGFHLVNLVNPVEKKVGLNAYEFTMPLGEGNLVVLGNWEQRRGDVQHASWRVARQFVEMMSVVYDQWQVGLQRPVAPNLGCPPAG